MQRLAKIGDDVFNDSDTGASMAGMPGVLQPRAGEKNRMRKSLRDRLGRWLIRHHQDQLANHLALIVMRPDAQPHAESYLPLWRERWTRREEAPPAGTPGEDLDPRITADCGAMKLLEQLDPHS